MASDPSPTATRGARQSSLAPFLGLPREAPARIHPAWRRVEPKELIGNGPVSGVEEQEGGSGQPTASQGAEGRSLAMGKSSYSHTPSEA